MNKYEPDRSSLLDGKLQSNDIVLFRYADVLLMQSEALVRQGLDGNAPLLRVRQRAGAPAKDATLDAILEERLVELAWEGWRRQDLVRFGKFTRAYDFREPIEGEDNGYTMVFPIPDNVILFSGNNISQNFGY
ncbi:MAG: RagB/SusD family nutrient uptake outer membrane protein [Bacteroidales bacterium]|nr:RagB/SusD family nutrient uptake outer membrane protein [Bacteroidales bacterium]